MNTIQWTIDPAHGEISFKVKHLMLTTVTGRFRKFNAEAFTVDDDFGKVSKIAFTAEVDSLDTHNSQRDDHLRSADFFDAASFPVIKFESSKYNMLDGKLEGQLTIRGTPKPVILDAEFHGIASDGYGQTKAGFSLHGIISRKEFGLHWNALTEAGGIVVGDEVKVFAEIQFIKQA